MPPAEPRYVPAAGRAWLTGIYDPVIALTMRERSFRGALIGAALADRPRFVLDVGCGTGTLAAGLARADPAVRVLGLDGDEQVLARARRKAAAGLSERVVFGEAMADALPVENASVDVVVASLLLHHLASAEKAGALREARRVLREDGRLLIADWGRPHDPLMRAAFFALQLIDGFEGTRDHVAGRLPELVARAGFRDLDTIGRWRTAWGSLELLAARPGAPPA